ncbi:hypothetical protein T492DRAFT_955796 [Pavlovales sp. CCMP2436]|nr:hypothetical protein T492DRAFT_955796 [Pavlovales sp. CCMP2436]
MQMADTTYRFRVRIVHNNNTSGWLLCLIFFIFFIFSHAASYSCYCFILFVVFVLPFSPLLRVHIVHNNSVSGCYAAYDSIFFLLLVSVLPFSRFFHFSAECAQQERLRWTPIL